MDSVELVMEFEEYFRIRIPDPDAEKLTTVGEVVDYVCSRLGISQEDDGWLDTQLSKLISAIAYLGYTAEGLNRKTPLYQCCNPSDKVEWQVLNETFGMPIPNPKQEAPVPGLFKRIFRQSAWQPQTKPESVTFEQLLVATVAHNLDRIVKPGNISTRLQVYAAVMRLTVDKTGVDYFEISPSASFTNDLGVD